MPERKTLNEDLFYKGSSANLPRFTRAKIKPRSGIKEKFSRHNMYKSDLALNNLQRLICHKTKPNSH